MRYKWSVDILTSTPTSNSWDLYDYNYYCVLRIRTATRVMEVSLLLSTKFNIGSTQDCPFDHGTNSSTHKKYSWSNSTMCNQSSMRFPNSSSMKISNCDSCIWSSVHFIGEWRFIVLYVDWFLDQVWKCLIVNIHTMGSFSLLAVASYSSLQLEF